MASAILKISYVLLFAVLLCRDFTVSGAGVKCRAPTRFTIPHGYLNTSDTSYSNGTTLTFNCDDNYYLDGSDSLVCTARGRWKPRKIPRCKAIACLTPSALENGNARGRSRLVGDSIRFKCNPGFTLRGPVVRTCQNDGTWSGQLPVCDDGASDCGNPGIPYGGIRIGRDFNVGDKVRYRCLSGLLLRGSDERVCTQNKTWSGEEPHCDSERSFHIPNVNNTAFQMLQNIISPLSKTSCANWVDGCTGRGRSISLNSMRGLDLVFLIDSSSSIGKDNFYMGLRFTCDIIKRFGVDYSRGGTRVAAITYSSRSDLVFNLGEAGVGSVEKACDQILSVAYSGGGTGTRFGLEKARDEVVPVMRKDSVRAMIIIADGQTNFGGKPYGLARRLRTVDKLDIYAIGVGKKVSMVELRLLAEKPSNIFQLKSYDDFDKLMDKIISYDYSVCGKSMFDHIKGRVSGGKKAALGQWPWQVSICINVFGKDNRFDKCQHICGGSLVNKNIILTAAHCFFQSNNKGVRVKNIISSAYRVRVGKISFSHKSGKLTKSHRKIKRILLNPAYNKATLNNDIALIRLTDEVTWSATLRPLCLPAASHKLESEASGYVAGWGNTAEGVGSDFLRYVQLSVKDTKDCDGKTFDQDTQFCAGADGKDSCRGDSGGSFVSQLASTVKGGEKSWQAVGIVSYGERCYLETFKGYYTKVSTFSAWLIDSIDELQLE